MTSTVATAAPTFQNDGEMERYYADPERSELLSKTLCWSDAVDVFKKGGADLIVRNIDNGDKWSAYRLHREFEPCRPAVLEMTQRLHKRTFDRSRA